MARPTKFTPEVTSAILTALGIGATLKDASEAAGVDYNTFNEWMKRGAKEQSGKFREFYDASRRVEAEATMKYLSVIAEAAKKGDWKAALEWLKRRRRSEWGDAVDVTSAGEKLDGVLRIIVHESKDANGA